MTSQDAPTPLSCTGEDPASPAPRLNDEVTAAAPPNSTIPSAEDATANSEATELEQRGSDSEEDGPSLQSQASDLGEEHDFDVSPEEAATDPIAQQDSDPAEDVLAPYVTQLRRLRGQPASEDAWTEFEAILETAIGAASKAVRLPAVPPEGRPRHQVNPENPQQIQKLYRRNRRRAVRLIVEGQPTLCPIPVPQLEEIGRAHV